MLIKAFSARLHQLLGIMGILLKFHPIAVRVCQPELIGSLTAQGNGRIRCQTVFANRIPYLLNIGHFEADMLITVFVIQIPQFLFFLFHGVEQLDILMGCHLDVVDPGFIRKRTHPQQHFPFRTGIFHGCRQIAIGQPSGMFHIQATGVKQEHIHFVLYLIGHLSNVGHCRAWTTSADSTGHSIVYGTGSDAVPAKSTVTITSHDQTGTTSVIVGTVMVNTVRQSGESALTQYEGESHNTPIVSVRDLEYGDYKVVIVLTNYSAANFVFDGFRVFNTMDSAIDGKVYDKDAESQPEFVKVRDNVLVANLPNKDAIDEKSVYINQIAEGVSGQVYTLKGDQKVTAVLMTEGGAALKGTDVTDYLDNGTKNEVYVRPGQYLLITLPNEAIAAKTQIGLKTLTGTATLSTKTISQTNMYYEGMNDGATIKIQNPWGTASIISVTDMKVPGGIPTDSTADTQSLQSGVRQALLWMGYEEEPQPTEPEPTEPEVTEPKPTEPSTVVPGDTYVSDKAYHRGDTVVFNGKTYRAKWWTRGENPETSQVWELVDDGNQTAAPAAWSPFKIYTAGMQVTYKGRVYEAKWWTIGLAPGKGWWSAWKQIS